MTKEINKILIFYEYVWVADINLLKIKFDKVKHQSRKTENYFEKFLI